MMEKLVPAPQPPITTDGFVNLDGVSAVIFRNAGTAAVNLWYGLYTLDSKETLSLNVTEIGATLALLAVPVSFETGGTNKLQIVALKKSAC